MNVATIKDLASRFSSTELEKMADEFEQSGRASVVTHEDPNEQMSDYLQAMEVRKLIESGMDLTNALREFSRRVRSAL